MSYKNNLKKTKSSPGKGRQGKGRDTMKDKATT